MRVEVAFGKVLKKIRLEMGLSQEKLALLCELDRTYIGLLERGQRKPTITTIFTIAENLDVKPSSLITEVELMTSK
ncbi:helix-turn-helix transcriptional regulator [Bacillus sp. NTK071]|uniref:helix-turn-helix domain-containing protein n=1 Tax=Bacillus sp. NTK071 TaxID=2802175 RepID=UPI001A902653|nr:helix-turn-helix transcriptional regulator [Bacillus sp. NTK071]MBN8207875.1 helix-turn-helix transcriptional regulator [Bacillus sp. NTK071]